MVSVNSIYPPVLRFQMVQIAPLTLLHLTIVIINHSTGDNRHSRCNEGRKYYISCPAPSPSTQAQSSYTK